MNQAPAIMFQGTGSNVGKSLVVAGLCRVLANRGFRVAPFKPQNMSNNAAVTVDGGEIGRAQALQAVASRREASIHMNPVLLKPETETGAQIVLQGAVFGQMRAREYGQKKSSLLPKALESFELLRSEADIVLVEGAGSPAEVNLRPGDIANMGFAEAADLPVVLIGDIDRGGVIAQLVGTQAVMPAGDGSRVKAFLINKFRGNAELFREGYEEIATRTGWRGLGVLPWFADAVRLPAEDALDLRSGGDGDFHVAVPVLSRIANFDDLDPLKVEPNLRVTMVRSGSALPGDADLVVLPGTKSTIADLAFLRAQGWDIDLKAHLRRGGRVIGICGGYQMLGMAVEDPDGIEGQAGRVDGLGLLEVETVMSPEKTLSRVRANHCASGEPVDGYEIHIGRTAGPDCDRPLFTVEGRPEGAVSDDGRVMGTYLHGCFCSDRFRAAFLASLRQSASGLSYADGVDGALDNLAAHIEAHLDVDAMLKLCSIQGDRPLDSLRG
ncbi:MAG: cobyric acid synthase [Rhodospirillales bacterium]|nr:cobyric acid synthase [Rhodospirillales bacterium]